MCESFTGEKQREKKCLSVFLFLSFSLFSEEKFCQKLKVPTSRVYTYKSPTCVYL